jgi:hypothetical protein
VDRVRVLQNAGLLVFGGFILGFDNDTDEIFDQQIEFINQAAIPNAMIGQLGALPGTPLLTRMQEEGRLLRSCTEGLGPFYSNFVTKLPFETIVRGQRRILETIYEPRAYFDRLFEAYRRLPKEVNLGRKLRRLLFPSGMVVGSGSAQVSGKALPQMSGKARATALVNFLRSVDREYRREALRFMRKMLLEFPEYFQQSLDYLVMGYHYYRFTRETVIPEYEHVLANIPEDRKHSKSLAVSASRGMVQITTG